MVLWSDPSHHFGIITTAKRQESILSVIQCNNEWVQVREQLLRGSPQLGAAQQLDAVQAPEQGTTRRPGRHHLCTGMLFMCHCFFTQTTWSFSADGLQHLMISLKGQHGDSPWLVTARQGM